MTQASPMEFVCLLLSLSIYLQVVWICKLCTHNNQTLIVFILHNQSAPLG